MGKNVQWKRKEREIDEKEQRSDWRTLSLNRYRTTPILCSAMNTATTATDETWAATGRFIVMSCNRWVSLHVYSGRKMSRADSTCVPAIGSQASVKCHRTGMNFKYSTKPHEACFWHWEWEAPIIQQTLLRAEETIMELREKKQGSEGKERHTRISARAPCSDRKKRRHGLGVYILPLYI